MVSKRTVINHGILIDPGNSVHAKRNIAIEKGKVAEISADLLEGEVEIDASGLVVAPGFIDMHMHEDPFVEDEGKFQISIFESELQMGVTTTIGGNCGIGTLDPKSYLEAADQIGLPVNVGLLVPHESLRLQAGADRRYEAVSINQLEIMKALASKYMMAGCLGISFGIRYIPGITELELMEISSVAQKYNTIIAAHLRNDADHVMRSAEEFMKVGRELDLPVQFSHMNSMAGFGQMETFLQWMDQQALEGFDIASDCYPYEAFSTFIGTATYDDGFLERYQVGYEAIEVAEGPHRGERLTEELFHFLRETAPKTLTIAHVMKREDVDKAIIHPRVMIASDGLINGRQGHPRAAGTFPRVLGEYVRERRLMSLYQAINKMTAMPARQLGIKKGTLEAGADADITLFNPDVIQDKATFKDPMALPMGIKGVWVSGQLALWDGVIMQAHKGRAVKKYF